jgi:hypothetical protein
MNLKSVVSSFRNGILGNRQSDNMCAAICYPLQGYLSFLGIETEIIEADFGNTNHVWLKMKDGRIIDPTADQFSGPSLKFPKVYIGDLPPIYQKWMSET